MAIKTENELDYNARQALTEFLITSYPNMTCEEMVASVKMNLIGYLAPVKLPNGQTADRVECFGRIDAQYLTHVFLEFQKSKQRAMLAFREAAEKLKDGIPAPKTTPKEHLLFVLEYYRDHQEPPKFADWNMLFVYLWKNKKLNTSELTQFREDEEPKLKAELWAKLKSSANRSERSAIEIDLQANSIQLELRKRYIAKWLKEIRIEDYISAIQEGNRDGQDETD